MDSSGHADPPAPALAAPGIEPETLDALQSATRLADRLVATGYVRRGKQLSQGRAGRPQTGFRLDARSSMSVSTACSAS
jgi:hypothetical protein